MILDATLAKLLEAWQDGGLPEAEEAELLRQLASDAELRRCFAGQVALIGAVRAAAEQNPRWLALFDLLEQPGVNAGDSQPLSFEAATMERIAPMNPRALPKRPAAVKRIAPRKRRAWYDHPALMALAAVVALLLAAGFLLKPRVTNDSNKLAVVPAVVPAIPAAVPAAVAVMIGGSPETEFKTGTYLKPGVISQKNGWMTIQTLEGVCVTFDAPFQATLSDLDRIRLDKGRARVRVPAGAEGFQLECPAFNVVDLGTEFAAEVDADGAGTCRVFQGKVDVSLLDSVGEVKRTQRLTASNSVRISPSNNTIQMIEEKDSDYPGIKQKPRPTLALAPTYAADVLAMAPAGYWRFEAFHGGQSPNEVTGGPSMQSHGSATLAAEDGGNHSGELTQIDKVEFFTIPGGTQSAFKGDFGISYFVQLSWLQNFAMISAMRYDERAKGHSLILQCYADLSKRGIKGSALHAEFRDPPAWTGGAEIVGAALLRPLHWHHIAATRANGMVTLYLDGAPVARNNVGSMPLDCRKLFIGRLDGSISQSRKEARGLVGHIDELAIFPRALTDMEIRKLAVTEK